MRRIRRFSCADYALCVLQVPSSQSVSRRARLMAGAEETSNPVVARASELGGSAVFSDMEKALKGLKDGTATEAEAVEAMENLVAAHVGAKLDMLRSVGGSESTIRSVMAQLAEAPTNWHQGVVFLLTSDAEEDAAMKRYAPLMAVGGAVMVFVQVTSDKFYNLPQQFLTFSLRFEQCATVFGVFIGTLFPACQNNDLCTTDGMWCRPGIDRCVFCGDASVPMNIQKDIESGQTWNDYNDPMFVGYNNTRALEMCTTPSLGRYGAKATIDWCARCVHLRGVGASTGEVDPLTGPLYTAASVNAMGKLDCESRPFGCFLDRTGFPQLLPGAGSSRDQPHLFERRCGICVCWRAQGHNALYNCDPECGRKPKCGLAALAHCAARHTALVLPASRCRNHPTAGGVQRGKNIFRTAAGCHRQRCKQHSADRRTRFQCASIPSRSSFSLRSTTLVRLCPAFSCGIYLI